MSDGVQKSLVENDGLDGRRGEHARNRGGEERKSGQSCGEDDTSRQTPEHFGILLRSHLKTEQPCKSPGAFPEIVVPGTFKGDAMIVLNYVAEGTLSEAAKACQA